MDKLLYNSWEDVSISLYKQIVEITEDSQLSPTEINIAVLALLMGVDEDKIYYNYTVQELQEMLSKMAWLNEFKFNKNWNSKKIKINGKEYTIETDLQKMTIAQYIDFQTYWAKKDNMKYLANLLSCFIIPKGCKYNEGYDIAELTETIENNVPITTSNSILFFFLKELVTSIQGMLIYLDWMARKKVKDKKKMEQMEQEIQKLYQILINGLI